MGFKEFTPALLLSLTVTILLALVSFNTPLLKSLYFLQATYSSGSLAGTARFGTLGYCIELAGGGGESCTGPQVGYELDLNTMFGIPEEVMGVGVQIPKAVSKYLTYVLVLHIVALVSSVAAIILTGLSHIRSFSLLCFPSLFSWFTSACTLLALIIDLVIFYISKSRINSVEGASAEIGLCVWLVLAAWIVTALAGCATSCGICCQGRNRRGQEEGRRKRDYEEVQSGLGHAQNGSGNAGYGYPPNRQGPPIREQEVSVPLNNGTYGKREPSPEPKYLEDEEANIAANARPGMNANASQVTGSGYSVAGAGGGVVPGVGYGYGARRQGSGSAANGGYPPQQQTRGYEDPYAPGGPQPLTDDEPQYPGAYPQNGGQGQDLNRSHTPATYAGSFVGVGANNRNGNAEREVPPVPGSGPAMYEGHGGAAPGAPGYVPGGQEQGQGYGMAGVAAAGAAGMAGYAGYDAVRRRSSGYSAGSGEGYGAGQYGQRDAYDNYTNQYGQQMPVPQPNPTPAPSQSHYTSDPYSNPQPLYNQSRGQSGDYGQQQHGQAQDAYGGYETPNTAHPGISPVVYGGNNQQQQSHSRGGSYDNHYNSSSYPTSGGSGLAPVAPNPQRLNTNLPNNPGFSLTSPVSATRSQHGFAYSTDQAAFGQGHDQAHGDIGGGGIGPPAYDDLSVANGAGGMPQPNRRNRGSTEKTAYFN